MASPSSPSPSRRLGPYELIELIGKGGMGEVWRAHDARLGRDVAIKTSGQQFSDRFEREARAVAALNHPNVCTLHDVGPDYLVMELIEGPTLADRITEGPIPLEEALRIASQIADALDAAHEKNIVHRDLKPANIKLRPDGSVKVLDFGLAKSAVEDAAVTPNSPTMLSMTGMIMGTAGYMSPEQAKGKTVDKRADIFAFGVVLYEMVTGKQLFGGETISESLASIIKDDPDWSKAPARVERLLRKCLEKDPKKRLRDIGDWTQLLDSEPITTAASRSASGTKLGIAVAVILAMGLAVVSFRHFREQSPQLRASRLQISPPGPVLYPELSPDGRMLAFVASKGGPLQIWIRNIDTFEARPLPGTESANYPFWSPDGESLGFFSQGKLRRIAVAGGPVLTLCDADGRGGSWNRDGVILFASGPTGPILRIPAAGGTPSPVTRSADPKDLCHRFPAFLPDGVHFLYVAGPCGTTETQGVFVGSLNGNAPLRILPDMTKAVYGPAATGGQNGFLLFRREENLMAQPFNPGSLKTAGDAFPVADEVPDGANNGYGAFAVANNGTLAYLTGGRFATRELVWSDRTGRRLGTAGKPAPSLGYALSPDEKKLAIEITNSSGGSDLWLEDTSTGATSRFTFHEGGATLPVWSPDGKRIAWRLVGTEFAFYLKPADGNGQETALLAKAGVNARLSDWSPDGKWLAYSQQAVRGREIWLLPLENARKPVLYLRAPSLLDEPRFSPDGKWMAYQSTESGLSQVYVQSIPAGVKYQISSAGGTRPRWRRDGKEIYYIAPDRKLMAVPVRLGATVEVGTPVPLFSVPAPFGVNANVYEPLRDGQRFLVNSPPAGAAAAPINVVLNWQADLKK